MTTDNQSYNSIKSLIQKEFSDAHVEIDSLYDNYNDRIKVTVISDDFEDMEIIQQHSKVLNSIRNIKDQYHAITIKTMTKNEAVLKGILRIHTDVYHTEQEDRIDTQIYKVDKDDIDSDKIHTKRVDRFLKQYKELRNSIKINFNEVTDDVRVDRLRGKDRFSVMIISEKFESKSPIERSRMIISAIRKIINDDDYHAIRIRANTPREYIAKRPELR